MTAIEPETGTVAGAVVLPATAGSARPAQPSPAAADPPGERLSKSEIAWMLLGNFGASMAYIVPMAYSLSLRVSTLAPGHDEVLGYLTGTAQVVYLVASPLIGMWSDHTRSRFGRRRPFMIWGMLIGVSAVISIALAPTILLVGAAWVLGMVGIGTMQASLANLQADRLPDEQRARVSGFTGLAGQIGPVFGIAAVAAFTRSTLLVFAIPAVIGGLCVLPLLVFGKDADSRTPARHGDKVSIRDVAASYLFNPRRHPDFGWNWLGRFVFFLGLYANTTFSTFFYAQRLDVEVRQVAAVSASIAFLGIGAAFAGAIGAGLLSDKLQRRRLFTMIGALLFASGALVEAFAYSLPALMVGSLLMNLAIAAFSAVDQAIVISILPDRAQAGRYMAVTTFSTKIPAGAAPLLAPFIIAIGASGGEKNYTLLYLLGGVLAVTGGLIIFTRVKTVR